MAVPFLPQLPPRRLLLRPTSSNTGEGLTGFGAPAESIQSAGSFIDREMNFNPQLALTLLNKALLSPCKSNAMSSSRATRLRGSFERF